MERKVLEDCYKFYLRKIFIRRKFSFVGLETPQKKCEKVLGRNSIYHHNKSRED